MAATELDEKLRAFLEDHEETRRRGVTLESIAKTQETLANGLNAHAQEDKTEFKALHDKIDVRLSSHDHRITTVEAAINEGVKPRLERVEETTGSHNIEGIIKAAKGRNSSGRPSPLSKMLDGEISKTIVKGLILFMVLCAGWVIRHVTEPSHPMPATSSSARP